MGPVMFLLAVVVISAVGTLVLWARSRPPRSPEASIEQFNTKMRALSGEEEDRSGGRERRV